MSVSLYCDILKIHCYPYSPKKPTEASPDHGPRFSSRSAFEAVQHLCGSSEPLPLYPSKIYVENLHTLRDKRMSKNLLHFRSCVAVSGPAVRNQVVHVVGVFVLGILVERLCLKNQACREIRYTNLCIYVFSPKSRP